MQSTKQVAFNATQVLLRMSDAYAAEEEESDERVWQVELAVRLRFSSCEWCTRTRAPPKDIDPHTHTRKDRCYQHSCYKSHLYPGRNFLFVHTTSLLQFGVFYMFSHVTDCVELWSHTSSLVPQTWYGYDLILIVIMLPWQSHQNSSSRCLVCCLGDWCQHCFDLLWMALLFRGMLFSLIFLHLPQTGNAPLNRSLKSNGCSGTTKQKVVSCD